MGSPPFPMSRSCASTAVVTLTISAYISLVFFGLTAKQLLLSTVNAVNFSSSCAIHSASLLYGIGCTEFISWKCCGVLSFLSN